MLLTGARGMGRAGREAAAPARAWFVCAGPSAQSALAWVFNSSSISTICSSQKHCISTWYLCAGKPKPVCKQELTGSPQCNESFSLTLLSDQHIWLQRSSPNKTRRGPEELPGSWCSHPCWKCHCPGPWSCSAGVAKRGESSACPKYHW